ncbi:type III secretion system stalk subunit SctO [Chelativorans alearense]|uniref:type III secretion system stalk subunit SctO n=1 Tax=Chelativorans alearense TaxID=2681495 RepID=UPI0013D5F296|nr:YscO family type III secretion system apparatus protein [Chelativorans alearense]
MKDRETIARLRDLRRLREERAMETVIRRRAVLKGAQKNTQEAVRATKTHMRETELAEQSEFGPLLGQTVDVHTIHRIQGRFQKAALDVAHLRDVEGQAAAAERDCRNELTKARDDHRMRRRAVAKLDGLLERLSLKSMQRDAAREESREEEAAAGLASHRANGKA